MKLKKFRQLFLVIAGLGILFLMIRTVVGKFPIHENSRALIENINFSDIFEQLDEVQLQYGDSLMFSMVDLAVDKKENYLVCDPLGKQVVVFDPGGRFLRRLAKEGSGPGDVIFPLSLAVDATGNIYVADNTARRLSVFDESYRFVYSFILSAAHPVPLRFRVTNEAIFMGANNIGAAITSEGSIFKKSRNGTLLNKYSRSGKFLKTFYDVAPIARGTVIATSAICWPFFDIRQNLIFAVQNIHYKISVFDLEGKLLRTFGNPPTCFKALKKNEIPDEKKWRLLSFDEQGEFWGSFCKPMELIVTPNGLLILKIEMPRKNYHSSDLSDRSYNLDLYTTDGKFLMSCISTKYSLEYVDGKNNFYFSEIDYGDNERLAKFVIRKFLMKAQALEKIAAGSL